MSDHRADKSISSSSLSIIIEWENAGRIGRARAARMLAQLHAQLDEVSSSLQGRPEILLMHDPKVVTGAELMTFVRSGGRDRWRADVRCLALEDDAGYYEQKNEGAANTSGDVLLFLDSDVVPEPGWLRALLGAMNDPAVEVVCGTTSIEAETFYSSAFALFWFFPVRTADRDTVPSSRFFANNVAFRRSLFERHPFPRSGQFRGQCALLADELLAQGHGIWRCRAAHVLHPPPSGLHGFVERALRQGRDDRLRKARGRAAGLGAGAKQLGADLRRAGRAIRRDGPKLGVVGARAAAAHLLAWTYYGLKFCGYVLQGPEVDASAKPEVKRLAA